MSDSLDAESRETSRPPDPAALPGELFDSLEREGVAYAVWKDVESVHEFGQGDSEIDLLVPPREYPRLLSIARRHGYAPYRNIIDLYGGAVSHLIRVHDTRYFHLHCHQRLVTGDHHAKEYCLDAMVDEGWFRGPRIAGIRVVPPDAELLLGTLRLIMKAKTSKGMHPQERDRLRRLATTDALEATVARLRQYPNIRGLDVDLLRSALDGETTARAHLVRISRGLDPLRRVGPFAARLMRSVAIGSHAIAVRIGLSNKVSVGPAPIIAVMGVDGSGKSTLIRGLEEAFGRKVSVRVEQLGGNDRTYGMWSWTTWRLSQLAGVVCRTVGGRRFANDIHVASIALFEHAKCRDRVRRMRRSQRLSRWGIITIYERYPLAGLFDYPRLERQIRRGEIEVDGLAARIVQRLFDSIDHALAATERPQVIVLLQTPYDAIERRRDLDDGERRDIQDKLELLEEFLSGPRAESVQILENDGPFEVTLARLTNLLNRASCSSSS